MMSGRRRWCIELLQISATDVLTEAELERRLDAVSQLPPTEARCFGVQLRDPQLSSHTLVQWGKRLRSRTRAMGAQLIVNDRLDVALALEADGIHLGRTSVSTREARRLLGPGSWISRSLHGLSQLEKPDPGVDAWLLSPIFASAGKGRPLGTQMLSQARAMLTRTAASHPAALIALGGVDASNASACCAAGADGVAAIRADLTAWLRARHS